MRLPSRYRSPVHFLSLRFCPMHFRSAYWACIGSPSVLRLAGGVRPSEAPVGDVVEVAVSSSASSSVSSGMTDLSPSKPSAFSAPEPRLFSSAIVSTPAMARRTCLHDKPARRDQDGSSAPGGRGERLKGRMCLKGDSSMPWARAPFDDPSIVENSRAAQA